MNSPGSLRGCFVGLPSVAAIRFNIPFPPSNTLCRPTLPVLSMPQPHDPERHEYSVVVVAVCALLMVLIIAIRAVVQWVG